MANEAIIKAWFRKSRDDLFSAQVLLEANNKKTIEQSAYFVQQSIEKAMKGLIVFLGKRPDHVHDLEKLAQKILKLDPNIELIKKYNSEWKPITLYAIIHRYPDAEGHEGVEPPTHDRVSEIINVAKAVFDGFLKISIQQPDDLLNN